MTTINQHKELLRQSIDMLDGTLAKGIMNNPRAVAFSTSSGAADLLSILLHKQGKLPIGRIVEHQWFKKPQQGQKKIPIYEEKLGDILNIPNKEEICNLMCEIEKKRNILAYGNPTEEDVGATVADFKKLKKLIEELSNEKLE